MRIDLNMLDFWKLPHSLQERVTGRYMEYIKAPKPFVMQSHIRGKSQHLDFRMKVDGYLVGWAIVGGNIESPITPKRLLEARAKGFRAEAKCISDICNEWKFDIYEVDDEFYYTQASTPHILSIRELARQPLVWLKVEGEVKPGEVGAGKEAPGRFTILAKGKALTGTQKVWFHEYFIKGGPFKDWTRLVVRAVRGAKIDPGTKRPIKGQFVRFWRAMIPEDQMPYTISKRAMDKNWKPPRGIKPFPEQWTKKKYPVQYKKWLEYIGKRKEELAKRISYTLSLHKYRGPIHIRGMFRLDWYLFLADTTKGQIRTFNIKGDPMREQMIEAWYEGRDSRKYLDWEGKTKPLSRFNPNKELYGEMNILEKGKVEYESVREAGKEKIELRFKGNILKGTWFLEQEEEGAESYVFYKEKALSVALTGESYPFVYHRHYWNNKEHYDLRWRTGERTKEEFNIYGNLLEKKKEEGLQAVLRSFDIAPLMIDEWMIARGRKIPRKVGNLKTFVDVLDAGVLNIIERNPQFISMVLDSKKFKKEYVIAKKQDGKWIVMKASLPGKMKLTREGNPRTGSYYDPFIIEQKKGWDYFYIRIYDIRSFTRCEGLEKAKEYKVLPGKIPAGVILGICLYPVPGKIHSARVAYVKFMTDKWTPEKATSWIKRNKLHIWVAEQVRRKKEELAATLYPWMEVRKMDMPDRSCHGRIYTDLGSKDIILRAWTDDLALQIMELYVKGITMFRFRVYGGFITQIIDYKGKEEK